MYVVRVTFVASLASTVTSFTAYTTLLNVFVILKSVALRAFVFPANVAARVVVEA